MISVSKRFIISSIALILLFSTIAVPIASMNELHTGGSVGNLRGGFGVKVRIDNYQLAWGNRPANWQITIEGNFVLFGSSSGTISAMGQGIARSSLIPPAFGFGHVTVTLIVKNDGSVIAHQQQSGFMIGFLVILT